MGKIVQLGYNILLFFADYAAKKWPLSGQQKLGVKGARGRRSEMLCLRAELRHKAEAAVVRIDEVTRPSTGTERKFRRPSPSPR